MKVGKKRRGIKRRNRFLRPLKKVRGKINKRNKAVKIHSVSDVEFVLSTSFATYKIPRSCTPIFKKATRQVLQNVVCFAVDPSRIKPGHTALVFYWYGLDTIFDTDDFEKYKAEN